MTARSCEALQWMYAPKYSTVMRGMWMPDKALKEEQWNRS